MRSRIMRASARPTKKAPDATFTGVVWQDEVFAPEQPSRMRATLVSFTPAARTNWHTHAVGQVLFVVSGVGRFQLEGEGVQVLLPGDTRMHDIGTGCARPHDGAPCPVRDERQGPSNDLARTRQRCGLP